MLANMNIWPAFLIGLSVKRNKTRNSGLPGLNILVGTTLFKNKSLAEHFLPVIKSKLLKSVSVLESS